MMKYVEERDLIRFFPQDKDNGFQHFRHLHPVHSGGEFVQMWMFQEGRGLCAFAEILRRRQSLVLPHKLYGVDTSDDLVNVVENHEGFQFERLPMLHNP